MPTPSNVSSRAANLLLVRHGPSSYADDGRWMHRSAVSQFEDAYDAAGILDDSAPPRDLVSAAQSAEVVLASDLPRALASAQRLAQGRDVVTSPLLREIRLEPPPWIPIRLPIAAWDVVSHVQWSYRLLVGTDHEFVRRAVHAADWLEQYTRRAESIIVVTHGGFRRLLAATLVARGWRSARGRASYANWSSWGLARSTRSE